MTNEDIWTKALLSSLCRLSVVDAVKEANNALSAIQARREKTELPAVATSRDKLIDSLILGWPTAEDMKRVTRTD